MPPRSRRNSIVAAVPAADPPASPVSPGASIASSPTGRTHRKTPPAYAHTLRIHTHTTDSPLSANAPEPQNYRGLHNLVMLLLFVNNLRLVVENYLKYGLLLSVPKQLPWTPEDFLHIGIAFGIMGGAIAVALVIEWIAKPLAESRAPASDTEKELAAAAVEGSVLVGRPSSRTLRQRRGISTDGSPEEPTAAAPIAKKWTAIRTRFVVMAHVLNVLVMLFVSNDYATRHLKHPLLVSAPCMASLILCMKLLSFMFVNYDMRRAYLDGKPCEDYGTEVMYPQNLTLGNIVYFAIAPTLCYQPSYPRNPYFRKWFFIKRLLEFLSLLGVMYFLVEQYVRPTLYNSLKPFAVFNVGALLERILKLSIPSLYCWLIIFYSMFHCYLNLLAEILRFGDRTFYRPWWNAKTIGEYWRLWNLPVYQWFKRHVYIPLIVKHKFPSVVASLVAFFISAVGHEWIVGVPTGVIEGWAFWGMMFQIPMILLTDVVYQYELKRYHKKLDEYNRFRSRQLAAHEGRPRSPGEEVSRGGGEEFVAKPTGVGSFGNYLFWISFCILGQPIGVLLYYRAWFMREYPEIVEAAIRKSA